MLIICIYKKANVTCAVVHISTKSTEKKIKKQQIAFLCLGDGNVMCGKLTVATFFSIHKVFINSKNSRKKGLSILNLVI
jgi:malic enzyme